MIKKDTFHIRICIHTSHTQDIKVVGKLGQIWSVYVQWTDTHRGKLKHII